MLFANSIRFESSLIQIIQTKSNVVNECVHKNNLQSKICGIPKYKQHIWRIKSKNLIKTKKIQQQNAQRKFR